MNDDFFNVTINESRSKGKVLVLALSLVMCLGISFGAIYFVYLKRDTRVNEINSALISLDFTDSDVITLTDQVPVTDQIGMSNQAYTFTVTNTSKVPINAKIELEEQPNNTIPLSAMRYAFYVNDELVIKGNIEDTILYTINEMPINKPYNCKLIFWVDYYYEEPNKVFSVKVKATGESYDTIVEVPEEAITKILKNTEFDDDTNIKFYEISSPTNGEGLYRMASTSDDQYPIYYYRGNVNNNNIYFAESCWKIVRTTSTGGLKLIYNGEATDVDGKKQCLQTTGEGTQLPTKTYFNSSASSPAYVGYSLPAASSRYTYSSNTLTSGVYYGSSIDQTTYELVDPQTTLDNNHHYSYNSTDIHATGISGDTGNVRYYYYYDPSYPTAGYFIKFAKTKNIQAILNEMFAEPVSKENPSTIQGVINTWWSNYDATYGSYLEDTEWCNDRSIGEIGGFNPNGGDLTKYLYFSSRVRYDQSNFGSNPNNIKNTNQPILTCNNVNDKLTVSNGSLTYKIGLLTYDEVAMAGARWSYSNNNYYLYTNQYYWLLSPSYFHTGVYGGDVNLRGYLDSHFVYNSFGARPAVSLKLGTTINSGDGTKENPYIVGE